MSTEELLLLIKLSVLPTKQRYGDRKIIFCSIWIKLISITCEQRLYALDKLFAWLVFYVVGSLLCMLAGYNIHFFAFDFSFNWFKIRGTVVRLMYNQY